MSFEGSTIASASTLTFSAGVISDTFSAGASDVDMFRLELVAGHSYTIDVDNGTSGDFYLRIFDANGNEVRANDDGFRSADDVVFSLSPYVEFVPNFSGSYYIAISPYYLDSYDPFSLAGRGSPENPLPVTAGTVTVTDVGFAFFGSAGSINAITAEGAADKTDVFREEDGSLRVEIAGSVDTPTDVDIARVDLAKSDILVIDVNGAAGAVVRVFGDNGVQIAFDDDSGSGEDPELIFTAPVLDDYYIGISGDGNSAYNALDGTGTVAGAVGGYEVIIHRNPTQIGNSSANLFSGTGGEDYIVSLAGADTVAGGDGNDTLAGGDDADLINGGRGNDILFGESGDDTLTGAAGNDMLSGGIGNDVLNGSGGNDSLAGDDGDDNLLGRGGIDDLRGGDGNDTLDGGNSNDRLDGEGNDDTLNGGKGLDTVLGGEGVDTLDGQEDSDTLDGGGGGDIVSGGTGNDSLSGGLGVDTLNGGTGDDEFDFDNLTDGLDTITDFLLAGGDVIDLSDIFAATGSVVTAGNLSQFIQVTPAGGGADSFLAVDANGVADGLSFTIIAQVNGITTVQLFDIANFIV